MIMVLIGIIVSVTADVFVYQDYSATLATLIVSIALICPELSSKRNVFVSKHASEEQSYVIASLFGTAILLGIQVAACVNPKLNDFRLGWSSAVPCVVFQIVTLVTYMKNFKGKDCDKDIVTVRRDLAKSDDISGRQLLFSFISLVILALLSTMTNSRSTSGVLIMILIVVVVNVLVHVSSILHLMFLATKLEKNKDE